MALWFKSHRGTNTLVIDISSGSTSAAIVCNHKSKVPRVIASIDTPYNFGTVGNSISPDGAMLKSLKASLKFVLDKMLETKLSNEDSKIDKALVTFSSPWIDSYLKTTKISKEKEFIFDEKFLYKVIGDEKGNFQNKLKDTFKEESEIFESAVMDLYLNGYAALEPKKEKVSDVEISFILSASTKDLLAKVEDEIIRSMAVKKGIAMHSFMYVFYKVLSHSFRNLHSALLINMTTNVTDLLFIRHNNSALNATLPFGPASITESLAEKLNIPSEVANSYLALFADGTLDQLTTDLIDKELTEKEVVWKDMWTEVSARIMESADVPYSIFLITTPNFGKLMKTFLDSVFPDKNIILIGDTNTFTRELVESGAKDCKDEKILLLSSFSNLLN